MADIPTFTPQRLWMYQALWEVVKGRWEQGIYAYSGGCTNEQGSPNMTVQVDEFASIYGTTSAGNVTIDAHHDTLARTDVLYQTTGGAFAIWKGDNLAIDDPFGNYNPVTYENWQQLFSPYPKDGMPDGVPMYEIFVGPGVTAILDEYLMPIAAKGISGGGTYTWETMSGTGTSHTLAHSPVANSLVPFRNGVMIHEGSGIGYTRSGTAVTLTSARGSDTIMYWYKY